MKRVFKILFAVVGVIVALLVVAMVALPLFFDVNDYKPQINAAIEQQIGRKIDIAGDISLSVFPWLGIELGHIEVANAKGFGQTPMAEMAGAEISVRLLPLLSRNIEVGSVALDGLSLWLARDAKGRTNWAGITEHLAARQDSEADTGDVPQAPPTPESDDGGFKFSSLQIGAVEIRDAAVSWQDATTGADYRATDVKLVTGRLTDDEPVRMEFGGDFAAPRENVSGHLNFVARVQPDFTESFYRFADMSMNILVSGQGVPGAKQQANLTGYGELDIAAGKLKLSNILLQGVGLNIAGNIDGSGLNDKPAFAGRVTVKEFDPKAVMRELGIDAPATQNSDALSSAGFDAQFTATLERARFQQILATLDDSSLEGSASVKNFARPAIGFDLGLDEINVDDYLPPRSAEQARTDQPSATGGERKEAEIDLSALKDLRLDSKLAAGSLTAAGMHVTNAELAVKARDGVLTIEPLTADLYQGNLRVSARVDAARDRPRYALKGNLNGLQFQPLLKDVASIELLGALGNMNLDLSTAGKQVATLKRGLDGGFSFDLRDGSFYGFNLAKVIASARSRLAGNEAGSAGVGADEKTPFNRFAAEFTVNDGVMNGKDLKLASPMINATGTGSYDLAANKLDYSLDAQVPENASGKLAELAGVAVPIKLTGDLMSPDYSLDVRRALKSVAEQRLKAEKSKLQDKAREQLDERAQKIAPEAGDKVRQRIQDLFGDDRKDNRSP